MPPTIKDVAREAGVSISVVSYVLNNTEEKKISEPTRARVQRAAKKLGYIPNRFASAMRNQRSMSIGVVSYWELGGSVLVSMLAGVIETAYEQNYSVVMCNPQSGANVFSYIDNFLNRTVDAFVFIAPHEALGSIDEAAHIEKMRQVGVPFVIINGHGCGDDLNCINFDFYGSTNLATRHMIEVGYPEITYVAPLNVNYTEYQLRLDGYRDAVSAAGLPVILCDRSEISARIKGFRAVVTNKSDTAHAVMTEAYRQSLSIPADFALISGNTESYANFLIPSLSSVMTDYRKIGNDAVTTLIDTLNGSTSRSNRLASCFLQIRQTSP